LGLRTQGLIHPPACAWWDCTEDRAALSVPTKFRVINPKDFRISDLNVVSLSKMPLNSLTDCLAAPYWQSYP
jgi:hypothetical protein